MTTTSSGNEQLFQLVKKNNNKKHGNGYPRTLHGGLRLFANVSMNSYEESSSLPRRTRRTGTLTGYPNKGIHCTQLCYQYALWCRSMEANYKSLHNKI